MLFLLSQIDGGMAEMVAEGLGMPVPRKIDGYLNQNFGADADPKAVQPRKFTGEPQDSPPLSIARSAKPGMKTAKVAMLLADGFDESSLKTVSQAIAAAGGESKVVALHGGTVRSAKGTERAVDFSLPTVCSVLFDAVYVVGGESCVKALQTNSRAIEFVEEAHKHCKAIAATDNAIEFLQSTRVGPSIADEDPAVVTGPAKSVAPAFVDAISQHRNWEREKKTLPNG